MSAWVWQTTTQAERRQVVATHSCDYCGAEVGVWCRRLTGWPYDRYLHTTRLRAALTPGDLVDPV